jgi:two-component system C4-dicarboxylate transport sensor histidine kinase DctB
MTEAPLQTTPPLRRRIAFAAGAGVLRFLLVAVLASRWAGAHAASRADLAAAQMARTHAGLLASELQKFRLLPLVLTEYPDVRSVLERADPATVERLNGKLELLADRTDAAAIYVLDRTGRTLAASTWRLPTSFVGQNYGFRPYFREALANGAAEMFALGTVSGRPGLFVARSIAAGDKPLGVIVVKVEFDGVEVQWARQDGPTFVTDEHGVVIITSRPDWRFRAIHPLDEATRAAARRTLQFGTLPLAPLGLVASDGTTIEARGGRVVRYRAEALGVPMRGATLNFLEPLAPAQASADASARLAMLIAAVLIAAMLAWLLRARERRRMQAEARHSLETEVASRTAELRDANERITEESNERARADARFRAAREELALANRLGSIGQITAGVAHEINQPVAAIRAFAENAAKFLDRGDGGQARSNLGTIIDLTARIGAITSELRAFARRGTPAMGAVELTPVIDGALLLIGDRLRASGAALERSGEVAGLCVVADRVRLEQVLINLLQNALDALDGRPEPGIRIGVRPGETVSIEIADNGPGVAPELADQLFTPFVTGREDGLGLGLGIARDIAREFGGSLDVVRSPLGGAAFRITLRRA